MAVGILGIGFLEANFQQAINMLCDRVGLPRSEANAKIALKRLAVREIRQEELAKAAAEAESKPVVE
jgi:hypothetical protein